MRGRNVELVKKKTLTRIFGSTSATAWGCVVIAFGIAAIATSNAAVSI
jgi:hypothetical protein